VARSERLLACAVAAAALAWGWPALTSGYEGPYDEGNTLCAATRTLAGEVPYRDFWSLHPPGTTWLLVAAFRVFGATLGVERAVKLAVVALAAALVFLLARLATRPLWAAAAGLVFVALPTQTLSLRSRDPGLILVLATLLAACVPSDRPRRRALVAGLLAGSTVLFKQDFAAVAAAAGSVAVLLSAVSAAEPGRRLREGLTEGLVPFALGTAAAPLALAAAFVAQDIFVEFVRQAVAFPARSFARVRGLPVSFHLAQLEDAIGRGASLRPLLDAAAVPVLFGAALVAGLAGAVAGTRAFRRSAEPAHVATLAVGLAALLLLEVQSIRTSRDHLNPPLALGLVAFAAVVAPRDAVRVSRMPLLLGGTLVALGLAVSLPATVERARLVKRWALARPAEGVTELPAAPRWLGLPAEVRDTARFIAAESRPGERIFVGNARHDRLFYDAPLIYFLAGRPNATRYDNLHPGVATTRAVQEEIVRSLETARTRWIVLWDGPPSGEPNESSSSSGVVLLDEWIAGHGREAARFGSFRVLRIAEPASALTPAR
jgi:hypothetical protein